MTIRIITDSTAYLPLAIIKQYNIEIVPLNVHLPDKVFKEGVNLSNKDYYKRLKEEKIFPHTSQPSPADFLEVFNKLKPGDEAIVILISSRLSGALQSALLARDMITTPEINITIIDSFSTIMGLGFQVIRACELASSGKNLSEIKNEIIGIQDKMKLFFIVDNLEYLVRGGRISHIKGFIGNILKVKPILTVENGQINLLDKVRTRQKAISFILNRLKQDKNNIKRVAVLHVDAWEEAQLLTKKVTNIFNQPIIISEPGPVIGTHVGPGAIGIVYY